MKRILVPYDGSEGSRHAFGFALDLASKYAADLLVLAVVPIPEPTTSLEIGALLDNAEQHFKDDFAELRAQAGSVAIRAEIEVGHPAEHIVARAEKEAADLIVMGRRGRTKIGRFMLGSVSERVLRYAHCAVTRQVTEATTRDLAWHAPADRSSMDHFACIIGQLGAIPPLALSSVAASTISCRYVSWHPVQVCSVAPSAVTTPARSLRRAASVIWSAVLWKCSPTSANPGAPAPMCLHIAACCSDQPIRVADFAIISKSSLPSAATTSWTTRR